MPNKQKHAKNQREREVYYRNSRKQNRIDPTGDYGASTLQGSDDTRFTNNSVSDGNDIPVKKASFSAWLRDHWLGTILVPLTIAIIGFGAHWVFDKNAEIAVIQNKIDNIVSRIETLETDSLTKEYFELKVELLKKDLQAIMPDVSGIETRLTDLETRVDALEGKLPITEEGQER